MQTAFFTIPKIGKFEILRQPTLAILDEIELELQLKFGSRYFDIQRQINDLRESIVSRLLAEHFPERSIDSLIAEELKTLDDLFKKHQSNEKKVYLNLLYTFARNKFYVEFPKLCVSAPEGFDISDITDSATFDLLFNEVSKIRNLFEDKKKDSQPSLMQPQKSE